MGRQDYILSQTIELKGYPFYALIMAAMRKADSDNADILKDAFPRQWDELYSRYHAPGGYLPGEYVEPETQEGDIEKRP